MSGTPPKSRGLGRGLSALMADVAPEAEVTQSGAPRPDRVVPTDRIKPNPDQPRRTFEPEALEDLAASIREKGVIQPLIVRVAPDDATMFEIVAGERRWRAAQQAQLHEVPVVVREYSDIDCGRLAKVPDE